ncbi:MAG: hypothetical protein AAGL98_03825 [Planctomycetota bacterium]
MDHQRPTVLTDSVIEELARRLLADAETVDRRYVLGIAGIAGSGKSTLGKRLTRRINAEANRGDTTAAFVPMDGFHLRNAELIERGWKPRKGAAFTYDATAYVALLRRYKDLSNLGGYPVYCREAHEPVPSPHLITQDTRILVTEGQYLLGPETPWAELVEVFDACWWLDVTPEQARRWLTKRDTSGGRSLAEARAKYERNDRLNTEHVLARRREPDRVVTWPSEDVVS